MAEEEKKEEATSEEKPQAKSVEGSSSSGDGASDKPDASSAEEKSEVEVPKEFKKLVDDIEKMTVLELNELVKVLEKKFGVSAQAVAATPAAGAGGDGASEEQDAFSIELTSSGDQKIAVIKIVKEVLGLGLKEAKDMVDGVPTMLKEDVKKEEAEEIKQKIEGVGGKVELK